MARPDTRDLGMSWRYALCMRLSHLASAPSESGADVRIVTKGKSTSSAFLSDPPINLHNKRSIRCWCCCCCFRPNEIDDTIQVSSYCHMLLFLLLLPLIR